MSLQAIQFLGGPLDGHSYSFDYPAERLPRIARLEISPDVNRALTGERKTAVAPPTSTAIYCLAHDEDTLRYTYLGSIRAEKMSV